MDLEHFLYDSECRKRHLKTFLDPETAKMLSNAILEFEKVKMN